MMNYIPSNFSQGFNQFDFENKVRSSSVPKLPENFECEHIKSQCVLSCTTPYIIIHFQWCVIGFKKLTVSITGFLK